jgi:phosphoribosylanthranilate isomerase
VALPLRIKICGVTNPHDAQEAAWLGADAIGLNFHPGSPRHIDPADAAPILRDLPLFVEPVAVFVNTTLRQMVQTIKPLGRIRTVQWHGQNRELVDCYPLHYISAFAVRDADSLRGIVRYVDTARSTARLPSAILVDSYMPGQHGGTGRTAPWHLLAGFRPGVPLLLAGGLTPENVADAIRLVQPYGVDVASGVESEPGKKDVEKMRRFIHNAREAAARLPS